MLGSVLLLAALSAAPDVAVLRQELDAVAGRIEELKARREAGESVEDELTRLLVRSQELAEELDRVRPPAAAARPVVRDPARELTDELRAHAAALREEADRLAGELAEVERRIAEERRGGGGGQPVASSVEPRLTEALAVAEGGGLPRQPGDLELLLALRDGLTAGVRALEVQASILEAAAGELERRSRGE